MCYYEPNHVIVKQRRYRYCYSSPDELISCQKPLDRHYVCHIGDFVYSHVRNPGVIVDIIIGDVHKPGNPVVPDLVLYEVMFDENKPNKFYDARRTSPNWMLRFERIRRQFEKYEEKFKKLRELRAKYT